MSSKIDVVGICQNCLKVSPTMYVEFNQHIGALFIRFTKSIEADLCKYCINEFFWKFTLTTLFLGWWGIISFFVTPIVLIKNIVVYLGTQRLGTINFKQIVLPFTVICIIFICLLISINFQGFEFGNDRSALLTQSSIQSISVPITTKSNRPTNTQKPRVTSTKRPINAITPACIRWDKLRDTHLGKDLCVYGVVVKYYETETFSQIVRFSDQAGTFLLRSKGWSFRDLKREMCVEAHGVVKKDITYYYMEIGDMDLLESSMCDGS